MENHLFDGAALNVQDVISILSKNISLSGSMWNKVEENRSVLDQKLDTSDERFYGINTGFGSLYSISISEKDIRKLQENLLRSHACGVGPAAPEAIIRMTMLLKIISLSRGYSGIRKELLESLIHFYNNKIVPEVPVHGSLGASGDLAPLAHLFLPLIGEGEVYYKQDRMDALKAMQLTGINPLTLQAKEGLALINGTQYSLAWLAFAIDNAIRMAKAADLCAALAWDAFDCSSSPLHQKLHAERNQTGQIHAATAIRKWLKGSEILAGTKEHLQDPYSFRCAPQVHGASYDTIQYVMDIANKEINAVTDNPLVFGDNDMTEIVSGGNFHAQPLALASDFLAIALSELGSISERRSFLMLSGQRGLPPALATAPGLESGMMICQYTAASLVNRNKILSHPASTDSIVTSAGQEDHVSMAAGAGYKLYEVVQNTWTILAIEWMIACQALEYRRPKRSSDVLEEMLASYRKQVPGLKGDRSLAVDIQVTEKFLQNRE